VIATEREFPAQASRYGDIEAPAVILTSDRDPVVSVNIHSRSLARDMKGAELVTLPGTGHMPHQMRPDAIAAAVQRIEQIATVNRRIASSE
jgi:pimeloyl-ACP methyl ester carboxylesterase